MDKNLKLLGLAAGAAVVGVVLLKKSIEQGGGVAGFFQDLGSDVGSAAVNAVDGAVSGVVLTAGDKIGIPRTNESECEKAIREGRTWDASFACPAGRFLDYLTNGK